MPNNKIIYSLAFGNFVASISALIVVGISNEIANSLQVSIKSIGSLVTVFAITYALCAPLVAAISKKTDRRTLLALGLSAIFFGNGIIAISHNYYIIFIGRIISAIGSAIFTPLSILVGISIANENEKGKVSSIIFSGSAIATALGVPIGTFIGISVDWRLSFWTITILATFSFIQTLIMIPKKILTPTANFNTIIKVFKNKALLYLLFITVLQFGGQMILFSYISPWLNHFTDLGAFGISFVLILTGVGGIIGNIISGRATDRYGTKKVQLILIVSLIAIMPSLTVIQENIILGSLLFFLWGIVGQGFIAPQLIRIVSSNPNLSSASLSLNSSFINVGISLGAILAGFSVQIAGISALTWIAFGVCCITLLVFIFSWNIDKKA